MKIKTKTLTVGVICFLTSLNAISQATKKAVTGNPTWKGFYLGGNIGGLFGNNSLITSTTYSGGFSIANGAFFVEANVPLINNAGNKTAKKSGFTGGVQVGCNLMQSKKMVIGVEADFNTVGQDQTVSAGEKYTNVNFPFRVTQSNKTSWLMTLRPRIGFTTGKALIYGTAGLAMSDIKYQMIFADAPSGVYNKLATNKIDATKAGIAAGAGAEFKISNKGSVKIDYLYTQVKTSATSNNFTAGTFNASGDLIGNPTPFPNQVFTNQIKLKSQNLRIGFNYRF